MSIFTLSLKPKSFKPNSALCYDAQICPKRAHGPFGDGFSITYKEKLCA